MRAGAAGGWGIGVRPPSTRSAAPFAGRRTPVAAPRMRAGVDASSCGGRTAAAHRRRDRSLRLRRYVRSRAYAKSEFPVVSITAIATTGPIPRPGHRAVPGRTTPSTNSVASRLTRAAPTVQRGAAPGPDEPGSTRTKYRSNPSAAPIAKTSPRCASLASSVAGPGCSETSTTLLSPR